MRTRTMIQQLRLGTPRSISAAIGGMVLSLMIWPGSLVAAATQQEVFKSIQDSMGPQKEVDSTPVILLASGGVVALGVMSWLSRRQRKASSPEALNHPGRLLKEAMRNSSLSGAEIKQLKMLADSIEAQIGEAPSPLALLLCPSLLARGLKEAPEKLDRKAVAQIVRRFKIQSMVKGR